MNGQVVQMDYDVDAFNESFQELFNFLNEEIVSSIREQVKQSEWVFYLKLFAVAIATQPVHRLQFRQIVHN